jgi:hypothetical protein
MSSDVPRSRTCSRLFRIACAPIFSRGTGTPRSGQIESLTPTLYLSRSLDLSTQVTSFGISAQSNRRCCAQQQLWTVEYECRRSVHAQQVHSFVT